MDTILIVKGNLQYHLSLQEYLREEGHTAVIAENAEKAVAVLQEQQPDLMVMDVSQIGAEGIKAMEQIVRNYPGLQMVIYAAQPFWRTVMAWPAHAHLVKHADLERLKQDVRHALGQQPKNL